MEYDKLVKVISYYKETLANVLEENFIFKATIVELQNENQRLKEQIENNEEV